MSVNRHCDASLRYIVLMLIYHSIFSDFRAERILVLQYLLLIMHYGLDCV